MTLREATAADLDRLVEMGEHFIDQSVYRTKLAKNAEQLRALAAQIIASPDGVVLVAEDADSLVGMLAAIVYAHHMSGERIAGEVAWWVEPSHRGVGLRLLRRVEQWAHEKGAVSLQMIAPTADVETLYQRLGFEPVERTYQRRLA